MNNSNNIIDRTKIEQKLTNQFLFVFSQKYTQLRFTELPIQERKQLEHTAFYSVLKAGSISIATLLFLRTTRKIMLTSRMSTTAAASTLSQKQNQNHVYNSPFMKPPPLEPLAEQLQPLNSDPILRNMLSITEFFASVLVFITFLVDGASTVISEVAQIPLKEGQSIISEIICPDMITLYKQNMQMGQSGQRRIIETDKGNGNGNGNECRFGNEGNIIKDDKHQLQQIQQIQRECLTNPQSKILSALVRLCTNCQRRKSYERHLRSMELVAVPVVEEEDRMIDEDDGVRSSSSSSSSVNENHTNNKEMPFPIPPPGVPIDFPIDENESYNDDNNNDENEQHDIHSFG